MSLDMFLVITGPEIKGESRDKAFSKAIDILSWSSGVSNTPALHTGGGGGAGKAAFQDMTFTKFVDVASLALQLACAKGTHIDKAVLTVRKAGGEPMTYLTITLEHLMVKSVVNGGLHGDDRLTETIVLHFERVSSSYFMQDASGRSIVGRTFAWDIGLNAGA